MLGSEGYEHQHRVRTTTQADQHIRAKLRILSAGARTLYRWGGVALSGEDQMAVRVRYIVDDVDAAIAFYTGALGFKVEMHPGPGFAAVSRGDLHL